MLCVFCELAVYVIVHYKLSPEQSSSLSSYTLLGHGQAFQTQQTSRRYRLLLTGARTPASVTLNLSILHYYVPRLTDLFTKVLNSPDHVLHPLLPLPVQQNYNLRNRPHNRQLPKRSSRLVDCNFIIRMLYHNMYWLLHHFISFFFILSCHLFGDAFCHFLINGCCCCHYTIVVSVLMQTTPCLLILLVAKRGC